MTLPGEPGQVVVLNGPPRAGKSSLATAIQDGFDGVWVGLGVDLWATATPARYRPGIGLRPGGERPDLEPVVAVLYAALYESVAAHSRLGLNVVVDVGHHDAYSVPLGVLPTVAGILEGLPALLVGVRCPVEVIVRRREQSDSGRYAFDVDTVRRWEREVHAPGLYDVEVDTSVLSPAEGAELIRRRLDEGPEPTAFRRLATGARRGRP